jgi:hypothetical protein
MSQDIVLKSETSDDALLELGIVVGQSQTFGVLAGRCSAAQAQAIRRVREEKLYKKRCEKWEDFCPRYLRMCRAEADRIIRLLDEFGPAYFELSHVARISPVVYRAIAPAVSDGVLHHNGEAIALTAENSRKVAAAVAEIRSAMPKKSTQSSERAQDLRRGIEELGHRCSEILAGLDKIPAQPFLGVVLMQLREQLTGLHDQIRDLAA